jgi:multidrug efflux pump subunit AcrB
MRVNTADIPIIRIQVLPRQGIDFIELSELTEKVLKKRIEQLPGISMVDINGRRTQYISIQPNQAQLMALGIDEATLRQSIKAANQELGQLNIKDGQYRYFVRMANRLNNVDEIKKLPIRNADGTIVPLERVAQVALAQQKTQSYHLYNGQEGLVISVHKQTQAQMTELIPEVEKAIEYFKADYPQADFYLTQNQSELLEAGINNLSTSLIYGAIFAFAVLFLFMGNYRLPLIMGIALPVSLLLSFLLFKATGLSINIISLSGLALGLGMLIDNAIIVIDNISRKREEGKTLIESCIAGVNEVMAPLISSVLTTLAVFIPLVFLNGLSGALFYDQALSISIILGTSLLVAFMLLPLLYKLFFSVKKEEILQDTAFYNTLLKAYKKLFYWVWEKKTPVFIVLLGLIPLSYWYLNQLDTAGLPMLEKKESLITINWNAPIDVESNKNRVAQLIGRIEAEGISEADIGINQFLLASDDSQIEGAEIYFSFDDMKHKRLNDQLIAEYISTQYPEASYEIRDAKNAFDQIFDNSSIAIKAKLRDLSQAELISKDRAEALHQALDHLKTNPENGKGFIYDQSIEATINQDALARYGISLSNYKQALSHVLDGMLVTEIKRFGEVTPIRISRNNNNLNNRLQIAEIKGNNGQYYPMSQFISFDFVNAEKHITADATGIYQALEWPNMANKDVDMTLKAVKKVAIDKELNVRFNGAYFDQQEDLKQMLFILSISIALLYFILAAQFESVIQPFIVILTLPLGILGALLIIDLSGSTLNVMSAIGIIVMLGIMVNDAILKIDTINRLSKDFFNESGVKRAAIEKAIFKTSEIRLKPILMTSVTTILALLPVVFSAGIGADLQKPLVFAVIGGLTIGTFTALFFVPLAYWFLVRK